MSRCYLLLATVLALQPTLAAAETTPAATEATPAPTVATPAPESSSWIPPIAVGVNVPWDWLWGTVGASVYVGVTQHHAIRANFARFRIDNGIYPITLAASEFYAVDPVGTIYDVSASLVYYERRLWDGFMMEVGVLRRARDTLYWPEDQPKTVTETTTYAARAMIGWSWHLGRHVFIAAAIGGSAGPESGVETVRYADEYPPMPNVTREVDRVQADVETYLRLGGTFGE